MPIRRRWSTSSVDPTQTLPIGARSAHPRSIFRRLEHFQRPSRRTPTPLTGGMSRAPIGGTPWVRPLFSPILSLDSRHGLSHDPNTAFDSADFRNMLPRFTPEARRANQALGDLLGQ